MKSQADGYDDRTMLVGSENEKDLARARIAEEGDELGVGREGKDEVSVSIYEQLPSAPFPCT